MTALPSLTDTHCHLNLDAFANDLPQILEEAHAEGVQRILVPGVDLESSRRAVELAERFPGLEAAIGVHPHSAANWSEAVEEELRNLAVHPAVVAIGEIGLDYYRLRCPAEAQRHTFQAQLALAAELGLPVIIHNRDASTDLLAILDAWHKTLPDELIGRAGVLHAFSGDSPYASSALAMGFYLGIGGPITFPKAEKLREVVAGLPSDRLLTETDAPFLAPQPRRGRRNHPAYIKWVAEEIARLRNEELSDFAQQTYSNASRLFSRHHELSNRHLL